MQSPYHDKIEIEGHEYFSQPYSLPILSPSLRNGMLAIGVLALISVTACITLISFIIWRFITWRSRSKTFVGYNQYVLLVLNLFFADLQQSAGFLINLHWVLENSILAPGAACFTQGWLIHSGNISSGLFVLTIALHTAYTAVYGGRLSTIPFFSMILMVWICAYLLTGLGVWLHEEQYFVRAGSWCWVSSAFETDRLVLHYVWIFGIQSATLLVYIFTFFSLRQKTRTLLAAARAQGGERFTPNMRTITTVKRITAVMVLYPCVYILLTLPLATGRMWSMAHQGRPTSDAFACAAGSLLACSGWVDCLLYTITRRRLLSHTMPGGSNNRSRDDSKYDSLELGGGRVAQASHGPCGKSLETSRPNMSSSPLRNPRAQAVHQATYSSVHHASRHHGVRSPSPTSSIVPILLHPSLAAETSMPSYAPEQRFKQSSPTYKDQRKHERYGRSDRSWDSSRSSRDSFDEVETALPTLPARAR